MKHLPLPVLAFVLLLSSLAVRSESYQMAERVKRVADPVKPKRPPVSPGKSIAPAAEVRLPAPDLAKVLGEDEAARVNRAKSPSRVGIRRPIGLKLSVAGGKAPWTVLDNGDRVWTARLESEGAYAIRVRFENVRLSAGTEITVFDPASPAMFEGPFDTEYLAGRDTFWSSTVFSQSVVVECRVPAGAALPAFDITELTHRYVDPNAAESGAKSAAACNIDVTCEPAWTQTSRAVAGIGSVGASGELFCTGCLLSDSNSAPNTEYFLTADHCIDGQSAADSVEIYWNYQSSVCNGLPPNPVTVPRTTGGASILSSSTFESGNDHCFLQLRGTVPAGVTYAGWSSATPGAFEQITGIHHPKGDYKRISFGTLDTETPNYWFIQWSRGVTEPGSSGSPIFNAQKQLIGQLYGGNSFCENTDPADQIDNYGRFNVTFPRIRRWLLNEPVEVPSNDNFANARSLNGPSGSTTADTTGATREAGEPNHARGEGRNSVWYTWTAASSGNVTFETIGSSFDTTLGVYTGNNIGSLVEISSNDDIEAGISSSRVVFAAVLGQTYRIAADGYNGDIGALVLTWRPGGELTPPPNNNFANATRIPGFGGVYHGNNRGYSREIGEPAHAGGAGQRSAWWRWTPSISARVDINTVGSSFDTVLAVYTGSRVNALTEVASNDDIDYNAGNYRSAVSFPATAGTTYWIAVDGYSDGVSQDEGNIRLDVSQKGGTPSANNNFANATIISGTAGESSGNNVNFTRETGEPRHDGVNASRSAWWSWTSPTNGTMTFETIGSAFDTIIGVYTGTAVDALNRVTSNDDIILGDIWQSRATFNATAGTTYRIAVDGFFDAGPPAAQQEGNIRLAWRPATIARPQPDLTVWEAALQPAVITRTFAAGDCDVTDGCAVVGQRRLLTFGTEFRNVGGGAVELGAATEGNSAFVRNVCRDRFEWPDFAAYRLLRPDGSVVTSRNVRACVADGARWSADSGPASAVFTCGNQGISVGWAAVFAREQGCQWIDVTGVADGSYLLEIEIDPLGRIGESDENNNVVRVPVTLEPAVVQPNDAFASATAIFGATGTASGSNAGATTEAGEPASAGGATVWYRWLATCDGTAVFDTFGSAFDTQLAAFSGTAVNALTLLAEGDDTGELAQSEIRFAIVRGRSYSLRVDGFDNAASGAITLNWRIENPTGCGASGAYQLAFGGDGAFEVRFQSQNGVTYALEMTDNLARPAAQWTRLGTVAGNGAVQTLRDTAASQPASQTRYYRIVPLP
jgi:hypothetical protein